MAEDDIESTVSGEPAIAAMRAPDPASRRRFLALVGAAGGGAALSTLLAACGSGAEGGGAADEKVGPAEPANDLEILNYALFLEYLEEDFYTQVVRSGALRPEYDALARDVKGNEHEHVEVLESIVKQLGGTPVPRPKTRFRNTIAAGEQRILEVAAMLENLGAAAYLGQAANITNTRLLESALAIHTVEARHAAAFNEVAGNGFSSGKPLGGSVPTGAFAEPMTREDVVKTAAPFVAV